MVGKQSIEETDPDLEGEDNFRISDDGYEHWNKSEED